MELFMADGEVWGMMPAMGQLVVAAHSACRWVGGDDAAVLPTPL